jgi:Putative beta-barrel porin-2, OmpL-like. bbp2
VNGFYRYLNDIVVTYKASDKLTFTTEANLVRDDALGTGNSGVPKPANAFGAAQYVSYALSDTLILNARAEVYRDDNAAFVLTFPANNDFVNAELGLPNSSRAAPSPTTYGEITLGVTYKPAMPAPVAGLLIRPEVRYDRSLGDTHPFNRGTDNGSFTLASDVVLTF